VELNPHATRSLSGERESPYSGESLRESSEHHEVNVKAGALQTTNAKRDKSVVVLQALELALDHDSTAVSKGSSDRRALFPGPF
jgi:hypothetical protein